MPLFASWAMVVLPSKMCAPVWSEKPRRPWVLIGVLKGGGCSKGAGNWGTLRILREDMGNLREDEGNHHPPFKNPISFCSCKMEEDGE